MALGVRWVSHFADAGGMTPEPYISGSAYVRKMSDFPKGVTRWLQRESSGTM